MGRTKGRGKNVDITKGFFQQVRLPGRVSVQVSTSHIITVGENEISPTNGSRAALQAWQDEGKGMMLKLCQSWRYGTCASQAACANAHVLEYRNQMPVPDMIGMMNAFSVMQIPAARPCDNPDNSVSPKCLQRPQLPHQQPQSVVVDAARAMEHKMNNVTNTPSHGPIIPAPRSQQNNRQHYATTAVSTTAGGTRSINPSTWGRETLGLDTFYGGQQPHNPSPQSQQPPLSQPLQQQRQQAAVQGRGGWNTVRTSDDSRRQGTGVVLSAAHLDSLAHRPKDRCEVVKRKNTNSQTSGSFSGANSLNRSAAARMQPSRSPPRSRVEDTWSNIAMLNPSAGASVIWGDGATPAWDFSLNEAGASPTPMPTGGGNPPLAKRDTGNVAVRPNPSQLWSSLACSGPQRGPNANPVTSTVNVSSTINNSSINTSSVNTSSFIGISTNQNVRCNVNPQRSHSTNSSSIGITSGSKVTGGTTPSEALKSQLLRALVGGGADGDDLPPSPAQTTHSRSDSGGVIGPQTCTAAPNGGGKCVGLLNLLGGDEVVVHDGGSGTPPLPSHDVCSSKIQHLMTLLTTE